MNLRLRRVHLFSPQFSEVEQMWEGKIRARTLLQARKGRILQRGRHLDKVGGRGSRTRKTASDLQTFAALCKQLQVALWATLLPDAAESTLTPHARR
jgi:hypothetical protein